MLEKVRFIITAGTIGFASAASAVDTDYFSQMLKAADGGMCIGDRAVSLLGAHPGDANSIYCAATVAKQYRSGNCPEEDILAKLEAEGAGNLDLGSCDTSNVYVRGGGPADLDSIGDGSAGGGGGTVSASPS